MPNHRERRRSPDDRIARPNNQLRVDLYSRLLTQHILQDQQSTAQGFIAHWDDPDAAWDQPNDPSAFWDAIGLAPHYQTLFWVLETMEGEELGILEDMDSLIDPFKCPEGMLTHIAASFGYALKDDLTLDAKRVVVQGLFHAYKSLGQRVGFDVFYRMIGFRIINVFPLWKSKIHEDGSNYSRERYVTNPITAEPVGPAGNQAYVTTLGDPAIVPGSLRITDGSVVLKDNPPGFAPDGLVVGITAPIIGPGIESGEINYQTGELVVDFGAASAGPVTASYLQVSDEFPYRAARMDIEVLMNPGGIPIPIVDSEVSRSLLQRLDEVRPIHVLLRALTLAFELADEVTPAATDETGCVLRLRDSRDPFGLFPGLEALYMLDQAPNVRQDDLFIAHESGGTLQTDVVLEDRLEGFQCPGTDLLNIDADAFSQQV